MLELSKIIANALINDTALIAVVNKQVFPLLADQEIRAPFIVYKVSELPGVTKDNAKEYEVEVISFEETYNKALALNQLIVDAIAKTSCQNIQYTFTSGGANPFVDTDQNYYVEQKFNIKK